MQWFYVQRLSISPAGQTTTEYVGPFYGDPTAATSVLGSSDRVVIYVSGAWTRLSQ